MRRYAMAQAPRIAVPTSDCFGQAKKLFTTIPTATRMNNAVVTGWPGTRNEPGGAGLRIIALTGYGQDQDRRRTRAAGIDHHLVKPVDMRELRALLGSDLARKG